MRPHFLAFFLALAPLAVGASAPVPSDASLTKTFGSTVQPFLDTYCVTCHGGEKPKGDFDLSPYKTVGVVARDHEQWKLVLEKLESEEMPPDKAKKHPTGPQRQEVITWIQGLRQSEAKKHAGDPGMVLARRLSNSEYDYSIRDLTGVDLQPTKEFPVDPSNTAGFDNSGESLAMSPGLLDKYLKAAREVANHLFLTPEGFAFAPNQMLAETDRDQFCVMQIINFYRRQNISYPDYFQAAWRFKNRAALGQPRATLADFAASGKVSAKYLATLWTTLEGTKEEIGPIAKLQELWRALPVPTGNQPDVARVGCEQLRDYIVKVRAKVEPRFLNIAAGRVNSGTQPMMIWKNVQYATHRMSFDPVQLQVAGEPPVPPLNVANELGAGGAFGPGRTVPVINPPGDPDLAVPAGQRAKYEAAWAKFCRVFPDRFYMEERGRNYFNTRIDRGRFLSAGFHSDMGYFRDDQPLSELILDAKQQKELDAMWLEFDFMADMQARMYVGYATGEHRRAAAAAAAVDGAATPGDDAPPEAAQPQPGDKELTSAAKIKLHAANLLAQAAGGDPVGIQALKDYFKWLNDGLRSIEKARVDAEPKHLQALLDFAARAYRRPLTKEDRDDLLAYYHTAHDKDGLDHEAAMRDSFVAVLMSPDFFYRIDLVGGTPAVRPLSDADLASRLSYFLWSSIPDQELTAHAVKGDLHDPKVIVAQTRRMLADPRVRALAVEFGGNWLEFRRFESANTVDRERFASFNNDLRAAMFEEPVRFLMDVFQKNRPVLDCLYARDTFVNPALAKHYGMPDLVAASPGDGWTHVADATPYERGGLLPMAVFLTKNAPGLRTSPVKRGNWVVKNILGERIPPPPPNVPVLAQDEAKLDLPVRDVLARHRADPSCAACHARFDALGLVFEGFGPTGERRATDLAGRAVDIHATFPGGSEGAGLVGLQQYIRDRRQNDFVNNLCSKLVAFALGRSLIPSDDELVAAMRARLAANGYRFDSAIEAIVTSPQFLHKRARADLAGK